MLPSFFVSLHGSDQDDEDLDSLKTTFVAIRENIQFPIEPIELDISISDLPGELISEVLTHLSIPNFQSSRQICQRWNTIVKKEHFLNRIFDLIQQNQDKRKEFFAQGNPYQISYCIFKDQNLILDFKEYPLFHRLQTIIYANPNFFPKFWQFACSKALRFHYPVELPYQTIDKWLLHGKILFLFDPLDTQMRLNTAFQTLKNFIASDQHNKTARSKDINLLKLYTLTSVEADRQMLRIACTERIQAPNAVKPHPLEKWLEQVEIQWQLIDSFRDVQAQAQLQKAAVAAAAVTQAQPQ